MKLPELSIVITAYNEASHLESVIVGMARVFQEAHIDYEIRIVDNGSSDGTGTVVKKLTAQDPRIVGVALAVNKGYGGGILAGLEGARGTVVGWAHADGQADPNDVVRLYRKMRSEHRELGKTARVVSFESATRKLLSVVYFSIFQILFRSPYTDINGTPKLLTRHAMQKLSLESRDWFLDPEFVIKSLRYKMPIVEIETTWHTRRGGATKARLFLTGLEFFKNMLLYRFGIK
ncbi:MAG: glycosyltransferase family 2 protein [bacterium]|nr:glycosyltransferase family 2 protein [bacterium]